MVAVNALLDRVERVLWHLNSNAYLNNSPPKNSVCTENK